MKLENWSVVHGPSDPYQPPELWVPRLHGKVYGHPRFDDGKDVTTSRITAKEGDFVVTGSGSRYELGFIDPEYEKAYPNARERLFKSMEEAS